MASVRAVTEDIDSLAAAEAEPGISFTDDPAFFPEWQTDLPELSPAEQERLDLIKRRYLYHRQYGHLLEGAVNFIVISPLLEMAGIYDPPFHLRSEDSIRLDLEDRNGKIYQGRIDGLILQEQLWIILVESKRTSFSAEVALPQALAYMAANPATEQPSFGLVSNGAATMFVKLDQAQYGFSDEFSLNRRQNELYNILGILNHLKGLL